MNNTFSFGSLTITVLTDCLIRVQKGTLCDEQTQSVISRDFPLVDFEKKMAGEKCRLQTKKVLFSFTKSKLEKIILEDQREVTNFKKGNLKGTARTLDQNKGHIKLSDGVISTNGVAVLDDSKSLIVKEDEILSRPPCTDLYYFAYGDDYIGALSDFYKLSGQVPLVPRYALGNWWSRYKAYTQEEYQALMQEFIDKKIPITVSTIDMDWHWTQVVKRFGKEAKPKRVKDYNWMDALMRFYEPGWTGYSWNTELFPDHKALLTWLHEQGFKIPLNVHPATGVRFFEDQYKNMCKALGRDPKTKEPIDFDITDPAFREAYFNILHKSLEDEGVDFWWVDWQQGTKTKVKGLDPLWALNHYHYKHSDKTNERGLILSRFCGAGSQRYPLGFSGDSWILWSSLKLQPYFTATAANIGYTWWSHDIGGHMSGEKDDELYLRWLQLGVFSPINRLHSSSNEFSGKEPFKCSKATEIYSNFYLRLRHKLIPYLYSMNYRNHKDYRAICEPMYYSFKDKEAYSCKRQYMFGSELICAPIYEKTNKKSLLASTPVWLPKGRFTDLLSGNIYQGPGNFTMYRGIEAFPVLAKEGAIIPMYEDASTNNISLDQTLRILVTRGTSSFDLYEDDGHTKAYQKGHFAITRFDIKEETQEDSNLVNLCFTINKAEGDVSLLPSKREMLIEFFDLLEAKEIEGAQVVSNKPLVVKVESSNEQISIKLKSCKVLQNKPLKSAIIDLCSRYQGPITAKKFKYNKLLLDPMHAKPRCTKALLGPIQEQRALWRM